MYSTGGKIKGSWFPRRSIPLGNVQKRCLGTGRDASYWELQELKHFLSAESDIGEVSLKMPSMAEIMSSVA